MHICYVKWAKRLSENQIEKFGYKEWTYGIRMAQRKFVSPLAKLVCWLTKYELDLERWSYRKEGYKSYDIQWGNSFGLTRAYYAKDLGLI